MTDLAPYARWGAICLSAILTLTLVLALSQLYPSGPLPDANEVRSRVADLERRRMQALDRLASLPPVRSPEAGLTLSTGVAAASDTQMLAVVRDAALSAGAELFSSQVVQVADIAGVAGPQVMLRASGSQVELLRFASDLERSVYFFGFESFEIQPSAMPDAAGQLELSGVLRGAPIDAL